MNTAASQSVLRSRIRLPRTARWLQAIISSSFLFTTLNGWSALPATPVVTSFPVHVTRFAVDPVRPKIYATDITTSNVYVFNTSTLTLEATIPVAGQPHGLAISADNTKLFIANEKDLGVSNPEYIISVIDLNTLAKLAPLKIFDDATPYDVEDGLDGRLYVSTTVYVKGSTGLIIDDKTGAFIDYFPLGAGSSPSSLEISPDRKSLFSANAAPGNPNLVKFDVSTSTMSVLQTYNDGSNQITLSHDGSFICYAGGLDQTTFYSATALFTNDFSVKATFPHDSYAAIDVATGLNPDDTVAYQLDEEPNPNPISPGALSIHLRDAVNTRDLDVLIVDNNFVTSYPDALAIDHTGSYLFLANPFETLVYDVSRRIDLPGQLIAVVGSSFTYQVRVTFAATSFSAIGLPPGLTIDNDGLITGTPTEKGMFNPTLNASGGSIQISQEIPIRVDGMRLKNLSTRAYIQPDEKTLIGGFIVEGTVPKKVLVRGLGPSLVAFGLAFDKDPAISLIGADYSIYNNDWQFGGDGGAEVAATGLAPIHPREAALVDTLNPGAYTVVFSPGGGGLNTDYNGNALFEVYDLDPNSLSRLANVSSRAAITPEIGPEIAGIIAAGSVPDKVLLRGLGPSLAAQGVADPLADPILDLHNENGTLLASNNDWKDTQEADIVATGVPPDDALESAIVMDLPPGAYTAVLQGAGSGAGVCLVEVYHLF